MTFIRMIIAIFLVLSIIAFVFMSSESLSGNNSFINIGSFFETFIGNFSKLLANDGTAGIICVVILILLFLALYLYIRRELKIISVLRDAYNLVSGADDPFTFANKSEIRQDLGKFSQSKVSKFHIEFGNAWNEYIETCIAPKKEGEIFRNTVRPQYFFNHDDLGYISLFFKQLPSLFVLGGLFLTFLGIISAIGGLVDNKTDQQRTWMENPVYINVSDPNNPKYAVDIENNNNLTILELNSVVNDDRQLSYKDNFFSYSRSGESAQKTGAWDKDTIAWTQFTNVSMLNFLAAAKAKFYMSLTGLFCSIIFILFYRYYTHIIEVKLREFCLKLENVIGFITAESIANEQLETSKEQKELLDSLLTNLFSTLDESNKKLQNSIETAMSETLPNALAEQIDPILEKVNNASGDSVNSMVQGIGDSLYEKLNSSLNDMAGTLSGVNTALTNVSDKLGSAGENVSSEINSAVGGLKETVDTIQESLKDISDKTDEKLNETKDNMSKGINEASQAIIAEAGQFAEKFNGMMSEPLTGFSEELTKSLNDIKNYSETIGNASGATRFASDALQSSANSLKTASDPIIQAVQNLRQINAGIKDALEKGSFALDQSKEAIEKSIGALTDSVNNFESIINNATGIDEKLVAAHQEMQRFLNDSQEQIRTFATQTSENFNKVSTSLNEVLDGIEDYTPENKS